ncbi:MAG: NAD+ diphosphatase [Acidimicrobiales bacterium]|jgi:NAD+ diphosphatase
MFEPRVNLPEDLSGADGRWFMIDERQQILMLDGQIPVGVEPPVGDKSRHLMGVEDGVPMWAARAEGGFDEPEDAEWVNLRALFGRIPETEWALAGRASQLLLWERDHKFCGRCGAQNTHHANDRAQECPDCGLQSYPRISPAVIMLIERDDGKALLAWGAQFPGRFFSALAGFVEPGESLEECVAREVREEVGIEVSDITYFGSQPWPFPHSMMIGFQAKYAGGEITIQEEEIIEAGWYGPDELPPVPKGGMSIAGWLIEDWLQRAS